MTECYLLPQFGKKAPTSFICKWADHMNPFLSILE